MRLLFFTDTQCKAKNPSRRLDNFPLAMLRKYLEIGNVVDAAGIDYVIHGGDMFDLPRVSPDYVGKLAEIIRYSNVPWYVVPGNHDFYGYSVDTVDQTMLGLLARSGVVTLLTRKNPMLLTDVKDGFSVSLQGQEYYAGIDKGNPEDYDVALDSSARYHVLAAHGMLLDRPFISQISHTLISNIQTNADYILAGHYHPGYDPVEHQNGKTTIINPGSAARVEAGKGDDRIPQYVILEFTAAGARYKINPFRSAKPAADVLDFAGKQDQKLSEATRQQFKATLQSNNNFGKVIDVPTALSMVAADPNNNIDPQLIQHALAKVALVQQSADDAIPKLDGFIPSPTRVYITRAEAEDFMCWGKLDIEFDAGLNVIRGESNSGKTTILRLIKWVCFGEPSGSGMISTWSNKCMGRVHLSNGYIIERSRTNKSAGYILLTDPYGQQQKFEGFGNDVPPEVINAHQMPYLYITKDEKRNLAIANQLDNSFLVTETPSFRAAAIGRLTGVQHVDATVRSLNAENKAITKEIKLREKQIKDNEVKLTAYDTLTDELNTINQFQLYIDGIKDLEDQVQKLSNLKNTLISIDVDIDQIQQKLAAYQNMPTEEEIALAENEEKVMLDLARISSDIQNADNEILVVNKRLSSLGPILSSEPMIVEAEEKEKELVTLVRCKVQIDNADKDIQQVNDRLDTVNLIISTGDLITQAEKELADLNAIQAISDKLFSIDTDIMSAGAEIDEVDEKIVKIETDMGNLLGSDLYECPTCGQVVTKEILLRGAHDE